MKLEKAIEILTLADDTSVVNDPQDFREALKLGIKAMKRVLHIRTLHTPNQLDKLPGED